MKINFIFEVLNKYKQQLKIIIMAYLSFDRKALFTQEETKNVLKLTTKYYEMDMDLENMLFGLLDGYLYFELKELIADAGFESSDVLFIESLIQKLPTNA